MPFTRACVPEVDVVAGRIVIAPPAEVDAVGVDTGGAELAPPPPPNPPASGLDPLRGSSPQGEGEYCS